MEFKPSIAIGQYDSSKFISNLVVLSGYNFQPPEGNNDNMCPHNLSS